MMWWQETEKRRGLALWAMALLAAAPLFSSLTAFGIWDPWELSVVEEAQALTEGKTPAEVSPTAWLVAWGFRSFGTGEWSGRLPGAMCGLGTMVLAYLFGARFWNRRLGLYAALVTGTSPLFILNAVPMGGMAPGFLLQTLVVVGGARALIADTPQQQRLAWSLGAIGAGATAFGLYGALVGVMPALAALGATAGLAMRTASGSDQAPAIHRPTAIALITTATIMLAIVLVTIHHDAPGYSLWTGGAPQDREVPTFDAVLEQIFHGLSPWSAVLPLALALPFGSTASGNRGLGGILCALWCAAGYGAQTLYLARYGDAATFLPVVGASYLVASFVLHAEESEVPWPAAAMVIALLCGLLIRDYALYPESALAGVPARGLQVPDAYDPKASWAIVLAIFAASTVLSLTSAGARTQPNFLAPYRLVHVQWQRGGAFRVWLVLFGLLSATVLVRGVFSWIAPEVLHMTTLGRRIARSLGLLLLCAPVGVAALQALWAAYGRARRHRFLPVAASGTCVSLFVAHAFLPSLSEHLSPREVYRAFNRVAKPGEPLAEYRVGGGAAAYYAKSHVRHLHDPAELNAYLTESGRRWAAIGAKDLPTIDARYRKQRGRHLFILGTGGGSIALASTEPVTGHQNHNPLVDAVRSSAPPEIQVRAHALFDGRIELLGYDLRTRHAGYAGAGESFTLTWYYRILKPIPTDYSVFVHIDKRGGRIHGDHEPVGGSYPTHLWATGDVIADQHDVDVPASAGVGEYTIFMGFYRGDKRMPVIEGDDDGVNRVNVGVLRIR